jgi:hypothetical protein
MVKTRFLRATAKRPANRSSQAKTKIKCAFPKADSRSQIGHDFGMSINSSRMAGRFSGS